MPKSSGTVAAHRRREHGRLGHGRAGAGPRHLEVGNEVAVDRLVDVDGIEMGRRRRVGRPGALKP